MTLATPPATASATHADPRLQQLRHWLADGMGRGDFTLEAASADASFRRYFRVQFPGGETRIAMDAPPDKERPAAFLDIARRLHAVGLSAPRILGADTGQGFILLEDFGHQTYTRALAAGADETGLYRLAVDTLIALHQRWTPALAQGLTPYDAAALLKEAALLPTWYWPAAMDEAPCPPEVAAEYEAAWRQVLPVAQALPATLVLRDYHVDNLMVLTGRTGVEACGLLDFQDALLGAPAYDLVSLLRDARRDVPAQLASDMRQRFQAAFPALDPQTLDAAYWVLGAQRTSKIIGIFTRLDRRDHKPAYLSHMPRLWRLLEEELNHPALAPVRAWFDRHLPPERRITPRPQGTAR